jgi:hypothetical protein
MSKSARYFILILVVAVVSAGARRAEAQCSVQAILASPALIDTSEDGKPTPGVDQQINPLYCAQTKMLTITNPWQDCNGSGANHNQFLVGFDGKTGLINSVMRDRGDQQEEVDVTGLSGGQPDAFSMKVTKGATQTTGNAFLIPGPGGNFTGIHLGAPIDLDLDFVYEDINGDGKPDYLSLPWAQMGAVGAFANCGPSRPDSLIPQIFIPLSNGKIAVDDVPGFPPGPKIAPDSIYPSVPTLSRSVTMLLAVLLLSVGMFQLRRSGLGF